MKCVGGGSCYDTSPFSSCYFDGSFAAELLSLKATLTAAVFQPFALAAVTAGMKRRNQKIFKTFQWWLDTLLVPLNPILKNSTAEALPVQPHPC